MTGSIIIKSGRDKPIRNLHPWIFSGAVQSVEGQPDPGDIVTVKSRNGNFLARGYWNPKSQIQVRLLTWEDEPIDDAWWRQILKRAFAARLDHHGIYHFRKMCRLVNAENDYLPGLILDLYGDFVVLQALTLYINQQEANIAEMAAQILSDHFAIHLKGVYERSDVDVRSKEGLHTSTGVVLGEEPPEYIALPEEKLIHLVDIRNGHKTGFYLDQIENQAYLSIFLDRGSYAPDTRILNLFSYTGGFGLATVAHVTNVDSSHDVLELGEKMYALNNWSDDEAEFIQADAFVYLHDAVERGDQYDIVILDPPKFAHNKRQIENACRGYKDLNMNALKIIKPGGFLMTFSCSGAISADLFQKVVFGALIDAGRQAQIIKHLGAGDDHPVALTFPEGAYLKGLLLRVY